MTTEEENMKILVDAVWHKYDAVADVDNSLNTALEVLFVFEITLLIGYASFALTGLAPSSMQLAVGGLILLGISLICLLVARFLFRKGYWYPFSVTKARRYIDKPTRELLSYLIEEGHIAINRNRKRRNRKKKLYSVAILYLIFSALLLLCAKV